MPLDLNDPKNQGTMISIPENSITLEELYEVYVEGMNEIKQKPKSFEVWKAKWIEKWGHSSSK